MANMILPAAERALTPVQTERLDSRRRYGQLNLVIGCQCLIISILMLLWSGQDATYGPGWAHPMLYWDMLLFVLAMVFLGNGVRLRRGINEFFSY